MYHKWQSYDAWFLRYGAWRTDFCVILDHFFFFFLPLTIWKIKILKNWRKHSEISSFYTSVPKIMIMLYCSLDMVCNGCNCYFSFWAIFAFLPHQNLRTIKKTPGDIIILHRCTINDNHMMYGYWDMERDGQNFLSFWTIFCTFIPLTTQNIKI